MATDISGMTGMTGVSELRPGQLFGLAAQRVTLRCQHGNSDFIVLPGRNPAANLAALDVLWVRHIGRRGCECERVRQGDPGVRID